MQFTSAIYTGKSIIVLSQNEVDSLSQDGYGNRTSNGFTLEPYEALYLMAKERLTVLEENTRRALSFQELLEDCLKFDSLLWTRYIIYMDIKGRGFVAKRPKEKGVSFQVFERGEYMKKPFSYYIYAVYEGTPVKLGDLIDSLRKMKELGVSLKLAVVDRRGEIVYYSLNEIEFEKLRTNEFN